MNLISKMPYQTNRNKILRTGLFSILIMLLIGTGLTACAATPVVVDLDISAQEAYQLFQEDIFVLDVRTPEEYQEAHLPGAILIPLDQLETRTSELPRNEPILVYCRSGNRSAQAQSLLLGAGFSDIYNLDSGINSWIQSGYEVEVGD